MAPTPLGEAFIRRAAIVLQEVRRAREEFDQLRELPAGIVTVGLSIAVHLASLPAVLRPFETRFEGVTLDIIEGHYPELELRLRDGAIDFYVGPDPGERLAPELMRDVLATNRRTIIGRTGHPLASATSLQQLGKAKWVTTLTTAHESDEIGFLFRRHGLPPPRVACRSRSALTLLTCLANSDWLALAPTQWSDFALTRGTLTPLSIREELAAPAIVVVKRTDLPLTPAARFLLDLLSRTLRPRE